MNLLNPFYWSVCDAISPDLVSLALPKHGFRNFSFSALLPAVQLLAREFERHQLVP